MWRARRRSARRAPASPGRGAARLPPAPVWPTALRWPRAPAHAEAAARSGRRPLAAGQSWHRPGPFVCRPSEAGGAAASQAGRHPINQRLPRLPRRRFAELTPRLASSGGSSRPAPPAGRPVRSQPQRRALRGASPGRATVNICEDVVQTLPGSPRGAAGLRSKHTARPGRRRKGGLPSSASRGPRDAPRCLASPGRGGMRAHPRACLYASSHRLVCVSLNCPPLWPATHQPARARQKRFRRGFCFRFALLRPPRRPVLFQQSSLLRWWGKPHRDALERGKYSRLSCIT